MDARTTFHIVYATEVMYETVVEGRQMVQVVQSGEFIQVDKTLRQIFKENQVRYGTNIQAAKASLKELFGNTHLAPFKFMAAIWFSSKGQNYHKGIWFALHHIREIGETRDGITPITLSSGIVVYIEARKEAFMRKMGLLSFWKERLDERNEQMKNSIQIIERDVQIVKEADNDYYTKKD